MIKKNYYYIVAGLSDLVLDQNKLPQTLYDLKIELQEQLKKNDYEYVENILLAYDNINVLTVLKKENNDFENLAKYSISEIENEIKEPNFKEDYLNKFIEYYNADKPIVENMLWEDQLNSLYYEYMLESDNSFLHSYYCYNLNINNIFTAINARKFDLNRKSIFVGNNEITEALKQSSLKDFGLSSDFPAIEQILSISEESNLVKREKSTDMLKWNFIDELNTFNYFTIEVILAYILKMQMIERWIKLDEETGQEMFENLVNELKESFEFSKEFEINKKR